MYTDFDIRMKENYEKRAQTSLARRIPVIIRVDGKAFHSFCKRFEKPYDELLHASLNGVMKFLCENIQGAKFGQRHSDEISILVTDFDTLQTDAYFDYEVQKICSVVASMATAEFCRLLMCEFLKDSSKSSRPLNPSEKWPNFDCRCFNLPEEEINNYVWWRLLDCKRNSINSEGQANFSHKRLQGLSCDQIQELLWQEKGINWNDLPQGRKAGFVCYRQEVEKPIPAGPRKGEMITRKEWQVGAGPASKSELDEMLDNIQLRKYDE